MKLFRSKRAFPVLCLAVGLVIFGVSYTLLGQGSGDDGAKDAPKIEPAVNEIMFKAMVEDDVELLEEALTAGADPNAFNEEGISALQWAILGSGTAKTVYGQVRMLLAAGANPNLPDAKGYTPLHGAAVRADESVVTALLEAGGDANIANIPDNTPYEIALKLGNTGAVSAIEQASDFRHSNREKLMLWGIFSLRVEALCMKNLPAGPKRDEEIRKVNNFLVENGLLTPEEKAKYDAESIAAVNRISSN